MRLHGGYLKKENDKRTERKELGGPLTTVSNSVRALIEEKITKRQQTGQAGSIGSEEGGVALLTTGGPPPMTQLVPGLQENVQDTSNLALPQDLQDLKIATPDKLRRHSDSDHFVMKRPLSHYMSDKSHKRLARAVSESGDALPQLALADVLESSLLQGDYPAHVDETPSAGGDTGYMPQDDVFGTVELEESGSLNDVGQGLLESAGGYGASPGLQQFSEVSSYNRPLQSPTVNQSNQEAIGPPAPPPPPPPPPPSAMYPSYGGYSPLPSPQVFQYPPHSHGSPAGSPLAARHSPMLQSPLAAAQSSPLHKEPQSKFAYIMSRSGVLGHMQSPLASPAYQGAGYPAVSTAQLDGAPQMSLSPAQYVSHHQQSPSQQQQQQQQSYQPPMASHDYNLHGFDGSLSGYGGTYHPATSQDSGAYSASSAGYQPSYTVLMSSQASQIGDGKTTLNGRAGGEYYVSAGGGGGGDPGGYGGEWSASERRQGQYETQYGGEYRLQGYRAPGQEDGDEDVFLSPGVLSGGPLRQRKRRPAPLFIPPQVHSHQYQSSLRSPALYDPSAPSARSTPPYTAPPMLPPSRPGPGLYWNLLPASGPGQPRSAPAQPRHAGARRTLSCDKNATLPS
ncbi:hypothetical protein FJT64_018058 [Amphibalanus amphitrite]|uniref:Uncharacterized protein n=1 Tax=Amphibalanus amphitrite TaxID=1232801 RepID=A0A6A4X7W5_AMPAM|nr:hypothetical protein FJT64_018058 [Amphibalanus amphitrite]